MSDARAERTNGTIVVTLPTIAGDPWRDWRAADPYAEVLLRPDEHYAARSHSFDRAFHYLVQGYGPKRQGES